MESVNSALSSLMRDLGMENALTLHRIRAKWEGLFGETVGLHAFPIRLSGGELLVGVDSPVWLQEMSFQKGGIVEKLRGFGVRCVRLKLGRPGQMGPLRHNRHYAGGAGRSSL